MSSDIVFWYGGHQVDSTVRVDKHFEGMYTLLFIASGEVELWYDTQRHLLTGAWFWICAPGPRTRYQAAPPRTRWSPYYTTFSGPAVHRWQAERLWLERPQAAPPGKDYAAIFELMVDRSRRTDHWSQMRARNCLESIFIDLAEARSQAEAREPWLDTVLRELDSPEVFMPDYARIAQSCGIGLSTLRRRFKEITGVTLHSYLLRRRMATACNLLIETDQPIKAIADQLGYGDIYFFSNQFRQQCGMSPMAYRRNRNTLW